MPTTCLTDVASVLSTIQKTIMMRLIKSHRARKMRSDEVRGLGTRASVVCR